MQFEVNGKNYFLQFSSEEGQWFLLTPGQSGVERYVIANDTESSEFADVIIPSEPDPYVN